MTTVRANSSVTEVVSMPAQLRLMNLPTYLYRFACLLLLATLALQAPLIGQETIQPQRIVNLDGLLGRGAATGERPPSPTAKLDLGFSKFKQALSKPAFASKPQNSFESVGTPQANRFGAQVPNLQSTYNVQLPYSFSPDRMSPQTSNYPPNYQPTPLTPNHQIAPTPTVSTLPRKPEPNSSLRPSLESDRSLASEQTSIPIQGLKVQPTSTRLPQTETQDGIEFELLPTVPGSLVDGEKQMPSSETENLQTLPEFPAEAPFGPVQENGQAANDSVQQPSPYIDPVDQGQLQTQQPTQLDSQFNSQPYPPNYPVAPELGYPGGNGSYQETGLVSPPHWGVDTRAQTFSQPQHFYDPNTGAIVTIPGTIGNSGVPVGSANAGSFPINPSKRESLPLNRVGSLGDIGKPYDFETKKKEFPPMREILATGRYFGSAELLYIKPHFQNNNAILINSPANNFGNSQSFDFSFTSASRFKVGFESKYGPGLELNYFQFDRDSNQSSFTSDGIETGTAGVFSTTPGATSTITAQNAGEVLTADHGLEVHRFGATFFKDWQLPVTRLGGGLGFQQIRINQTLDANVSDTAGNIISSVEGSHDFRAFGPQLTFRYFRPVGHTKLELIGGISGAVLFGNRDQTVQNSVTGGFDQVGSNDVLMLFEVIGGLQYVRNLKENRSFYARLTLMNEIWLGGGNAGLTSEDFGFRGFGFAAGFNR